MNRQARPNSGWTKLALIISISLSCFLIAIGRAGIGTDSSARIAAQESAAPLAALAAIPLSSVERFFEMIEQRRAAFADNRALREEITVLRERQIRYENLAMKVARYEAILGVDTQTDMPLEKIAARAIGETNGPFVRSLLITAGRRDGVTFGNPVLSTEGLVGHIINAGPSSSRVLRLSDLNSRIPVASARSGATAILAGDNTDRPRLSFMSQRTDWEIGDQVISSGDDGALPRGLPVGQVVQGEDGAFRVDLASRNSKLDWIWVSPFVPVEVPSEEEGGESIDPQPIKTLGNPT